MLLSSVSLSREFIFLSPVSSHGREPSWWLYVYLLNEQMSKYYTVMGSKNLYSDTVPCPTWISKESFCYFLHNLIITLYALVQKMSCLNLPLCSYLLFLFLPSCSYLLALYEKVKSKHSYKKGMRNLHGWWKYLCWW